MQLSFTGHVGSNPTLSARKFCPQTFSPEGFFMHRPVQRKHAAEAAHGSRASKEDDPSLLDYAVPRKRSLLLRSTRPSNHSINFTVTVVPSSGTLSTVMSAPCRLAACFTMERPSPVPPISLERLLSTL